MSEEELKGLLRRNIELAEDTNRLLHSMNRRAFWGTLLRGAFWIIFVIVPAVAFYLYAAPYISQAQDVIKASGEFKANPSAYMQQLFEQYTKKNQ